MPSQCMFFQAKSYFDGGSINNQEGKLVKAICYGLERERNEEQKENKLYYSGAFLEDFYKSAEHTFQTLRIFLVATQNLVNEEHGGCIEERRSAKCKAAKQLVHQFYMYITGCNSIKEI